MPRKKKPAPVPAAALNDAPAPIEYQPKWKDPGKRIAPERIEACLHRIFIDYSKRLGYERSKPTAEPETEPDARAAA